MRYIDQMLSVIPSSHSIHTAATVPLSTSSSSVLCRRFPRTYRSLSVFHLIHLKLHAVFTNDPGLFNYDNILYYFYLSIYVRYFFRVGLPRRFAPRNDVFWGGAPRNDVFWGGAPRNDDFGEYICRNHKGIDLKILFMAHGDVRHAQSPFDSYIYCVPSGLGQPLQRASVN